MKRNRLINSFIFFITLILISSCATTQKGLDIDKSNTGITSSDKKDIPLTAEKVITPYILGPEDVIKINVENHPEISGDFTIGFDGNIFIPTIGKFKATGLSEEMITTSLTGYLSNFINEPKVTTKIVSYVSEVIYIYGAVNRPGKYPTGGKQLTVRDAIILAGLPAEFAATNRLYIISPGTEKVTQKVVNLDRILYRGELKQNIVLKSGDIVYLPKNFWGKLSEILGSILSPVISTTNSALTATALKAVP